MEQVKSKGGCVQPVSHGVVQAALRGHCRRRELDGLTFLAGLDPIIDFVPMDGHFVRGFDAEPDFVAGHAEDFHADPKCWKDYLVVAATR
jgi:hypothetical protein